MAQIALNYSAAQINAAIAKINSLVSVITGNIVQLYNGTTAVYPRTKAEAVFFNNDTSKTLDQQFIQLEQDFNQLEQGLDQQFSQLKQNLTDLQNISNQDFLLVDSDTAKSIYAKILWIETDFDFYDMYLKILYNTIGSLRFVISVKKSSDDTAYEDFTLHDSTNPSGTLLNGVETFQYTRTAGNFNGKTLKVCVRYFGVSFAKSGHYTINKNLVIVDTGFEQDVYQKLEELEQELTEVVQEINKSISTPIDLTNYISGFYYTGNVGRDKVLYESASFKTVNVSVVAGEKYVGSSKCGGSSMAQFIFWDANDELVQEINRGDNANHYNQEVIVPNGAVSMSFCGSSSSSYEYSLNKITYQSLSDSVDTLSDSVDTLSDSVDTLSDSVDTLSDGFNEITEFYASPNLFDKTEVPGDNKVVITNGSLSTVSSWTFNKHTPLIPVEPNKYYRISGCNILDGINIVCFGADGTTKMKVLAPATGVSYSNYQMPNTDGTGASSTMNVQFKTPSTAAYVQFNVATKNIDATDTTMIELVGDTYNPNFIPSEYEEYGSKTIIKENALPIDIEKIDEAIEKSDNAVSRKFKVKLLLVGSSHGMNTISQFPWIAYKSGIDIEVGNVYIGSFSLQRLVGMNERNEKCTLKYFKDGVWTSYENKSFAEVFGYTDWDFISVQRSASDDQLWLITQNEADTTQNSMTNINYGTQLSAVYMSHNEALQYVLNLIRNNVTKQNCEVIFNSGFADPAEGLNPSQTSEIISTAKDMKEQFGIDYVPVAIAVRNARNTYLRHFGNYTNSNANIANQLCYDSQHLDYGIGCYVPSMCLLEFICRKIGWGTINLKGYGTQAEVGSFISVALTDANYTEPTDETMIVAKTCAMCACDMFDSTSTKLSDRFKWQIVYNLSNGITASNTKGYCGNLDTYLTTLSGTISSVVITSKPWDRTQPSTTLVEGTDYTYDSSTGKIVISSVQGDITISAV